jgi:hypothetical protein
MSHSHTGGDEGTANAGTGPHEPKNCGTSTTPPCPPGDTFTSTRKALIDLLVGGEASDERREVIKNQVNAYLVSVMHDAVVLIRGARNAPK